MNLEIMGSKDGVHCMKFQISNKNIMLERKKEKSDYNLELTKDQLLNFLKGEKLTTVFLNFTFIR